MGPPAHAAQGDQVGQLRRSGGQAAGARASEAALRPLVEAARRGDRRAFDQIVRLTWATTYTLAFRLTGDAEDALDVTQEAYLKALKGLPRFRGEARFSTWMYRVTASCASNQRQRAKRSRHDRLDPDRLEEVQQRWRRPERGPEEVATAGDDRQRLEQALLRLPLRLRQVVVLRDVYDLSHKAIAAELGTSEAAAKMGIQRARQRLRADLSGALASGQAGAGGRRAVLRRRPKRPDGTVVGARPVVDRDDDAVAS
jgi:RNA polymerase sigma-70 factor, ECF subfamily